MVFMEIKCSLLSILSLKIQQLLGYKFCSLVVLVPQKGNQKLKIHSVKASGVSEK